MTTNALIPDGGQDEGNSQMSAGSGGRPCRSEVESAARENADGRMSAGSGGARREWGAWPRIMAGVPIKAQQWALNKRETPNRFFEYSVSSDEQSTFPFCNGATSGWDPRL